MNLPIGGTALVVTGLVLHLDVPRVHRRIDWSGAGILVTGVICILLATTWAGGQYPWGSPEILGLSGGCIVLLYLFCVREQHAQEPLVPPGEVVRVSFDSVIS